MDCSCPTCLETFTQNCLIYSTPCGHIYHLNCIERWLKDNVSCPQCRKRCIWSDLRRIYLSSEGSPSKGKDKVCNNANLFGPMLQLGLTEFRVNKIGLKSNLVRIKNSRP